MFKKVFGIAILLVLAGIVIGNFIEQKFLEEEEPNIYDVTGDTNVQGGAIAPVESVGIEAGEAAPDFELETLDGQQFKLSDLKGKKVILNFWYTWCPPCIDEMPEMQKFYEDYGDEVEIIAVNLTYMEKSERDVQNFIDENSFTYTIPMDRTQTVADEFKVHAAPTSYFIGTDGFIQEPRRIGPMDYEFMEEMVQALN